MRGTSIAGLFVPTTTAGHSSASTTTLIEQSASAINDATIRFLMVCPPNVVIRFRAPVQSRGQQKGAPSLRCAQSPGVSIQVVLSKENPGCEPGVLFPDERPLRR